MSKSPKSFRGRGREEKGRKAGVRVENWLVNKAGEEEEKNIIDCVPWRPCLLGRLLVVGLFLSILTFDCTLPINHIKFCAFKMLLRFGLVWFLALV